MTELDRHRPLCAGVAFLVLIGVSFLALRYGTRSVPLAEFWRAFFSYDATNPDHLALRVIRAPRLPAAMLAGAALGVSGALMQSLTRNPLADPGLLGINGGAALGIVMAASFLGISAPTGLMLPALFGALFAAILVFALGGGGQHRNDPARLLLAGSAISAFFFALTWSILTLHREALDAFRFWTLGGFANIDYSKLYALLPFWIVGGIISIAAMMMLNALLLGEDTARSLGVRVGLVRLVGLVAVVLLCATTVALAGPIAFVGLMVPHLAKPCSGSDTRWLLVFSMLFGAILTISADVAGRLVLHGQEIEAGAVVAFLGGPALVALVRLRKGTMA